MIKTDDLGDFEVLFKRYYPILLAYGMKWLNNQAESEDIVQEVFFSYWKKSDKARIDDEPLPYLLRAIKNQCLKKFRHQQVVRKYHQDSEKSATEFSNPELILENQETLLMISKCLGKLPEKTKKIFMMNRFERKKYGEIADEMNISIKTVESHMSKTLKSLRSALKGHLLFTITLIITYYGG